MDIQLVSVTIIYFCTNLGATFGCAVALAGHLTYALKIFGWEGWTILGTISLIPCNLLTFFFLNPLLNCQHKKWSADGDKASLAAAQKLLTDTLPTIKSIDGVKGVQRIVCGGCLDFKVITSLDAAKWGDFESGGHGPEVKFLEKLKAIDGITEVETQTYTIMPL